MTDYTGRCSKCGENTTFDDDDLSVCCSASVASIEVPNWLSDD